MENAFERTLLAPDPPPSPVHECSPILCLSEGNRGPNYLNRSHPAPACVKYRANPEKIVKLSGCSMGEGCTQEEKDYFLTWVADCRPAGQCFVLRLSAGTMHE